MLSSPDIRDQAYQFFIQESMEFLQALEEGLLVLHEDHSVPKIHVLMRAAHSIKGGAASIGGMDAIVAIAHQMEDVLRALYQDDVIVDATLEELLLQAYDCLRNPLIQQIETNSNNGEHWLAQSETVFAQLVEILGEAMEANNELPTAAELGVDIVQVIFMGDIEEGLIRMATVLANPDHPEVAGELRAQAQVFLGMGELVNLMGFVDIAKATQTALECHPAHAKEIGQIAHDDFRAAQILVLGGERKTGGSPSEALLAWTKPGVRTVTASSEVSAPARAALMNFFGDDSDDSEISFIESFQVAQMTAAGMAPAEAVKEIPLEKALIETPELINPPIASNPWDDEETDEDWSLGSFSIGDISSNLSDDLNDDLAGDLAGDLTLDDDAAVDSSMPVDASMLLNMFGDAEPDLSEAVSGAIEQQQSFGDEDDFGAVISTFSPPPEAQLADSLGFEQSIAFTADDFSIFNDLGDQFGSTLPDSVPEDSPAIETTLELFAETPALEEAELGDETILHLEKPRGTVEHPDLGWTFGGESLDQANEPERAITLAPLDTPEGFFTWDTADTKNPAEGEDVFNLDFGSSDLIDEEDTTIQLRSMGNSIIDEEDTSVQAIEKSTPATPQPLIFEESLILEEDLLLEEEDTEVQLIVVAAEAAAIAIAQFPTQGLFLDVQPETIAEQPAQLEAQAEGFTETEVVAKVVAEVVAEEVTELEIAPTKSKSKAKPAANNPSAAGNTPAFSNTIRVDLGRLDRLNNLIGELVTQENSALMQSQQIQSVLNAALLRFGRFEKVTKQLQGFMDSSQTDRARMQSQQAKPAGASQNWENPVLMPGTDFDPLQMDAYNDFDLLIQETVDEIAQLSEAMRDISLLAQQSQKIQRHKQQTLKQVRNDLLWARMIPIGDILQRFPRMIRDLSSKYSKPTVVKLSGTNTLVDKAMLEKLFDPLVHLVRNGFDHGIEATSDRLAQGKPEQATLEIRAYHRSSQIYIEVSDDGRGINLEKIRDKAVQKGIVTAEEAKLLNEDQIYDLMFSPGFSTADKVSELSGRGVGLDAVRTQVRALKGNISIISTPGKGTTFVMRLPLTLTITKLLVFSVQSRLMAVAVDSLVAIVAAPVGDIQTLKGGQFYHWQEQFIPIYPQSIFAQNYQIPQSMAEHPKALTLPTNGKIPLLLIAGDNQTIALQADQILYEQELAIKPFGKAIAPPEYLYGCTLLGDGTLLPVIDARTLVEFKKSSAVKAPVKTKALTRTPQKAAAPALPEVSPAKTGETTILVIDDSLTSRQTLSAVLKKSGYRVLQARDGREGIEQLQQEPNIHLVFCDIEMPRMNGFEFLTHCRPNYPKERLPIVMLTSRSNEKHRQIAKYMGATTYLTKPFMEHELVKTLESCLTERFQMMRHGGALEEALTTVE